MSPRRRPKRELRIPWAHALMRKRGSVLVACLSFAVLFVQVSHPGLHPLEVVNPIADGHHACPLSHTAAALLIALPLLMGVGLALGRLYNPPLWLGYPCFIHRLAPRPPPV
jgi:hypothetical protein